MTQRGTRTDKNPTRVGRSTKINRPILAKSHQSSDWNPPNEAIRKTRSQSRPRTNLNNDNISITSDMDQSTSQFRKV